jgi:hypothetical protein
MSKKSNARIHQTVQLLIIVKDIGLTTQNVTFKQNLIVILVLTTGLICAIHKLLKE